MTLSRKVASNDVSSVGASFKTIVCVAFEMLPLLFQFALSSHRFPVSRTKHLKIVLSPQLRNEWTYIFETK